MTSTVRTSRSGVEPLFLERWSPRAFDGSEISEEDLLTLFDAARWAPSAFNAQPWRFLYARRGDEHWDRYLGLLLPFNAVWAAGASLLTFIVSDTLMQRPGSSDVAASHSHSFDAGAAWALLALQATRLGYAAHGMTGINFAETRDALNIPERFRIEAAAAIGRRGDPATLSDTLRAREVPSDRKVLSETLFAGTFPV